MVVFLVGEYVVFGSGFRCDVNCLDVVCYEKCLVYVCVVVCLIFSVLR